MTGPTRSIVCALAVGVVGGALLTGCGGGTTTVTVSNAPTVPGEQNTARTGRISPTPKTARTTPTTPTSTNTVAQGKAQHGASTTRTAPAPAFVHTTNQSPEQAASTEAAAAAHVVEAQGYAPNDTSTYHPNQTLRVLIGTRASSADGHDQRAFFFLDNRYLGTDSSQPSASLRVVGQSDTEVTLAYALYRPHDPLCCPSGGQTTVRFQLDNGRLAPLDPIPPVSSATGLARQ